MDTNFYYDDWGRMISKNQGSYDATYEYRYGDKLYSVTSNFPDEANVTYEYGGDGKRRTRETATSYRWYNWAGWNVINEEGSGNTLERTYIHDPGKPVGTILAMVVGTDPATGTWRYFFQDHLGSTIRYAKPDTGSLGWFQYTPYGELYVDGGWVNPRYMFTGKEWDDDAQMYYFPFRYYSPGIGRWISREPSGLDGPNLYWYGLGDPIGMVDPTGLRARYPYDEAWEMIVYGDVIPSRPYYMAGLVPDRFYGGLSPVVPGIDAFFRGVRENTRAIFSPYSNPCEPTVGTAKLWGRISLAVLVAAITAGTVTTLIEAGHVGPLGYHYLGKRVVTNNLGHLYAPGRYLHLNVARRHLILKLSKLWQQFRYWRYLR